MTSPAPIAFPLEETLDLHEDAGRVERLSPEYLDFMRRTVEAARADIAAGRCYSNEEVAAYFAKRRAGMPRKAVW